MRFRDRAEAGQRLAMLLLPYREEAPRVFGLNGGGVRVGFEVARTLGAPLETWVARTVEAPGEPGQRIGALSEGQGYFLEAEGVRSASASVSELVRWMDMQAGEVALTAQHLRGGHPRLEVGGHTAVLVVDGLGGGEEAQVLAALRGLRRQHPRRLVLAAPVATPAALERLRGEADRMLCAQPLFTLRSVAHAYDDFREPPDLEVRRLLERARALAPTPTGLEAHEQGGWM